MIHSISPPLRRTPRVWPWLALASAAFAPANAHASMLSGDALDTMANVLSWIVIFVVPIVAIAAFWLVHILPEKIAHKRKHPQTRLIQCLCLMSLVFGGILWPLAWILAYSKPVLHKLAYGTDVDDSHDQHATEEAEPTEAEQLRARIALLEAQLKKGDA